ncbi:MAG TPA: tyrosine-type recombinase/integrase [Iamia sp.]
MPRAVQRIHIYAVQDRRSNLQANRPWVVRWTVDGRERSRSFGRKGEAQRYRSELDRAVGDGSRFDPVTGEPLSWRPPLSDLGLHEWARRWLAEEWVEWAPRSRKSTVEVMARFVALAVDGRSQPPTDVRRYLQRTLGPGTESAREQRIEAWLNRRCLRLGDLDRERARDLAQRVTLKLDGTPMAAPNAARHRANCHACLIAAVEVGAIETDPWPRRTRSRSRRKSQRTSRAVDIRALPTPETMEAAIAAMANDKRGSLVYQAMTAVGYYAGLRPSETAMLRVRSLDLPESGWGRIWVTEADDGDGKPADPKTGRRDVPIPPVLVERLATWLDGRDLGDPDALLFLTERGTRPNQQNWNRAWKLALSKVGHQPLRVYDCRHAAATTWLRAGVPLGEVARRLGHSVDTLVANYVGALETDEEISNTKIDEALGTACRRPDPEPQPASARPHLALVGGTAVDKAG